MRELRLLLVSAFEKLMALPWPSVDLQGYLIIT